YQGAGRLANLAGPARHPHPHYLRHQTTDDSVQSGDQPQPVLAVVGGRGRKRGARGDEAREDVVGDAQHLLALLRSNLARKDVILRATAEADRATRRLASLIAELRAGGKTGVLLTATADAEGPGGQTRTASSPSGSLCLSYALLQRTDGRCDGTVLEAVLTARTRQAAMALQGRQMLVRFGAADGSCSMARTYLVCFEPLSQGWVFRFCAPVQLDRVDHYRLHISVAEGTELACYADGVSGRELIGCLVPLLDELLDPIELVASFARSRTLLQRRQLQALCEKISGSRGATGEHSLCFPGQASGRADAHPAEPGAHDGGQSGEQERLRGLELHPELLRGLLCGEAEGEGGGDSLALLRDCANTSLGDDAWCMEEGDWPGNSGAGNLSLSATEIRSEIRSSATGTGTGTGAVGGWGSRGQRGLELHSDSRQLLAQLRASAGRAVLGQLACVCVDDGGGGGGAGGHSLGPLTPQDRDEMACAPHIRKVMAQVARTMRRPPPASVEEEQLRIDELWEMYRTSRM
ncbi:hypothetical protein B484DRAFT_436758, partial [Ochromonadaceae sp. CCMP2298]